jgi:hypothetical protein
MGLKAYVEMYEGQLRKKQVNYKNFPQTTHLVMALIVLSTITFNVALWPHYGMNSPIILAIFFFGVILQVCMVVSLERTRILNRKSILLAGLLLSFLKDASTHNRILLVYSNTGADVCAKYGGLCCSHLFSAGILVNPVGAAGHARRWYSGLRPTVCSED